MLKPNENHLLYLIGITEIYKNELMWLQNPMRDAMQEINMWRARFIRENSQYEPGYLHSLLNSRFICDTTPEEFFQKIKEQK